MSALRHEDEKHCGHRITRREFARRALAAAGSLVAVSPTGRAYALNALQSSGEPVNDSSVEAMTVSYPTEVSLGMAGTDMKAYFARPENSAAVPAIIVIHDDTGLSDHIRDIARRVASAGYVAIAPDMLSRFGGTERFDSQSVTGVLSAVNRLDVMSDIGSTINYLKSAGWSNDNRVGVVGFGWGGGKALLSATLPDVDASVVFYGNTSEAMELFGRIRAPLLGIFASEDRANNEGLPVLEETLKRNDRTFEIKVYDGFAGFHDDASPERYDAPAAQDAWERTIAHFDRHLKN